MPLKQRRVVWFTIHDTVFKLKMGQLEDSRRSFTAEIILLLDNGKYLIGGSRSSTSVTVYPMHCSTSAWMERERERNATQSLSQVLDGDELESSLCIWDRW
uniref:(northern house mosquito) hypothetical protein n=1 Tax=Culex pipiens TaxID=7175 RepID=A0A8D8BC45_CULPI